MSFYRDGAAGFGKKPQPVDLSHHFSDISNHRVPSKMKEYYKFFQIPGIGNLAGGDFPLCTYLAMTY